MAIKKPTKKAEKIQAVREFTDRIPPRQVFWKNCDYLIQGQNDERKSVLVYYGVGGVGKTTLLKKLQSEIDEKNAELGSDVCKHIYYDFDLNKTGNMMTALEGLHQKLVELKCEFPLYDLGNFYYQMMIGKKIPEPEVKSLIDSQPTLRKWKERVTSLGDTTASISQGMSIVNSFLGIGFEFGEAVAEQVPCYKFLKAVVNFADKQAVKLIEKGKEIDDEHKEIQTKLNALITDVKNPKNLEDYLPVLFAQDVTDWLNEKDNEKRLVIFIDTYEYLVNEANAEAKEREKALWLKNDCSNFQGNDSKRDLGMVFNLDPEKTLWVIAGRDKLRWWGKEEEHFDQIEQHYVEALSKEDSNYFLSCAGIITQNLRDSIYELTEGSPFYLDACVEIYEKHMARFGKEPTMEDFGGSRDKVIERMINKYTDALTRDWIIGLCALEVWTDEMAYKIFPALSPTIYKEQIKNFSYISANKFNPGKYNFDRTVQRLLFDKYRQEHIELYKDIRDRANVYFDGMFDKKEKIGKDASFSLEQWAKIISRLTNSGEDLQNQYETHLYNVLKNLDWKMYNVKENVVETFYNRAGELSEQDTVPYAYFLYQYGKVKRNLNEYKVAYEHMKSAYETFAKHLGDEHKYTMKALYSFAKMAGYVGHDKESAELLDKYAGLCKKVLGAEDEKTLSIMKDLAYAYDKLENKEKCLDIYQEIFSIIAKKHDKNDKDYIDAELDVARALEYVGRNEEAASIKARAMNILTEKLDGYVKNIDNLDETMLTQASAVVDDIGLLLTTDAKDLDEWGENLKREFDIRRNVVQIYKQVLGLENEKTINAMIDHCEFLACSVVDDTYIEEIRQICEELLKCGELLYGKDDERMLHIYDRIVFCSEFADLDDMKAAANNQILCFRQNTAEDCKDYYGEGDAKTISAMIDVATQLRVMEKKEEELKLRKDILDICHKHFGDRDEKTLDALDDLAFFFNEREDYEEKLKIQKEILSIRKQLDGEAGEETITAMRAIAITLNRMERFDEELAIKKNILEILEKNTNGINEEVLYAMEDLAYTLREQEKFSDELLLRKKILDFYHKQYGEDSGETIRAKTNVADVMLLLKMYNEALKLWSEIAKSRESHKGKTHKSRISAELAKTYILCEAEKYEEGLNLAKEILGICSSADEPIRQKLLCAKILCFMLIATDKSNLSNKEEMKDKILSLFGWIGYHDRMHGDENFYGLHPEATIDGFIRISEELAVKSYNGYKECMTEALKLTKSTLGEDNEKTKKINELLENI